MGRIRSLANPMRMRRSLTLQTLTETDAANGGVTRAWANVVGDDATRRAEVKALGGREFLQAAQGKTEATHRVIVRYVPVLINAVDPTVYRWIDENTRALNVVHVNDVDGRHSMTECLVKESSI